MAPGVSTLRAAESQALSNKEQAFDSSTSGGGGFYTGSGRDNSTKVKGKGKKKGLITLALIASLMIGGGAFLGSSNSLLAPAMEALFTESTDTQYASSSMRYLNITRGMVNGSGYEMPEKFVKRLAKNDITVEANGLRYKGDFISANDLDNFYKTNVDFRDSYNTARHGRVMGFFDKIADKIYSKLGISRNLFSNFKQTTDADANRTNYDKTMSDKFEGNSSTDISGHGTREYEVWDEEKEEWVKRQQDYDPNTSSSTTGDVPDRAKAQDFLDKVSGASVANAASDIAQIGCTIMKVGNLISMTVAANELYQSINYFMGLMENISKMKAGYGDSSAINEVLNFFSTSQTTQISDLSNSSGDPIDVTGSPLESNGMQLVLANAPANTNTTKHYSLERVSKSVTTALSMSAYSAGICAVNDIANSLISLAVTVTPGAGLVKILGGFAMQFIGAVAIGGIISAFLGFLIPTIAQSLFTNAFETAVGKPAGELFTKGASAANTRLGRTGSGQSLSSPEVVAEYNQLNNTVLALDAEIDRKNLSPFDMTNKNTFFGSIAYSLLPTITSIKMTSLSALIRSTSTSLASLMGRVSADGDDTSYMTTRGDCPDLKSIGAAGDIYCNPITTTDLSTINMSPNDTKYKEVIGDATNCDNDGQCTIDKDSDLARYITYCDNRDSPFGVYDAGIASALQTDGGFLNNIPIIGDVLGIINGIEALDEENQKWATGAMCVNSNDNATFWQSKGKYYQRYIEDQRILEQMGSDKKNPVTAYEEEYDKEHPLDYSTAGIIAHYTGMSKSDAELMLAFIEYYNFIDNYDPSTRLAMNGDASDIKDGEELIASFTAEKTTLNLSPVTYVETPLETNIAVREHIVYADIRNRSYVA